LGFEQTGGFKTEWQVESDDYATRILERHWPDVRRWDDVCTFPPDPVDDWRVDVIAGGFPCQDISNAGKRAGIDGERSGLWSQFARIVGVLRPRYVVVENVAALLVRGMGRVCGDLAACGYDAEWRIVPAGGPGGVGAPHRRERVFLVGYADIARHTSGEHGTDVPAVGCEVFAQPERRSCRGGNVPDPPRVGMERDGAAGVQVAQAPTGPRVFRRDCSGQGRGNWSAEPGLDRLADGVPDRVDRLRCLGNAVVPAVARYVAESILDFEAGRESEC